MLNVIIGVTLMIVFVAPLAMMAWYAYKQYTADITLNDITIEE